MTEIAAIIPAFNEEDYIRDTVRAIKRIPGIDIMCVVDDASADGTADAAREEGALVVRQEKNLGKGAALNRAVSEVVADIYLLIDADLGESAEKIGDLLKPILSDHADMSIAIMRAPAGHKGGFGLVLKLARWGIEKLTGSKFQAPISGQRAVRRELIQAIGGFERGFGVEVALTIDALRQGYRVVEMELPLTHRLTGRSLSGFLHRGAQFLDIAKALWKRMR